MQFDTNTEAWTPAHDADVRVRNPWMLAVALALLALGSAALMTGPDQARTPPSSVAAYMP